MTACEQVMGMMRERQDARHAHPMQDQSVQTLTFLLQSKEHASCQTEESSDASDASAVRESQRHEDANLSCKEQASSDSESGEERGCSGGVRVREAVISARTTWMITYAASAWCSPTFATRMKEQRACFHRLKYFSCAVHKEMELEEEHSKRMHLEKELEDVRHLEAMRRGLHACAVAVGEHKHILEQEHDGKDHAQQERSDSKDADALDDTAFQGIPLH